MDKLTSGTLKQYFKHCVDAWSNELLRDGYWEIYEKLAAYEDTGLTPEEVAGMEWISVNDRMPEPEINVLLMQNYSECGDYAQITIGHLHHESDLRRKPYFNWIAYGADMCHPKVEAYHRADFICPGNEFVTHWMPLPQPPRRSDE